MCQNQRGNVLYQIIYDNVCIYIYIYIYNIYIYIYIYNLRELVVNYRHPSPQRVWKGGSDLWFTTSIRSIVVDPVVCSKLVFRVCETLLFALETEIAILRVQVIEGLILGEKKPVRARWGELLASLYVRKT